MPRQLPWQKSRTQVKQPPRPVKKQRILPDIDDDFFAGTVLQASRKGKERAEPLGNLDNNDDDDDDDDDDDNELPTTGITKSKPVNREPSSRPRAPSSSPPPLADLPSPKVENMEKARSKFDLRDDEWMMVEDEFLQTAKLFTQHLHLAEYEELRKMIDEKKKDAVIARPVVPGTKPSEERSVRMKVLAQEKKQRKAIRDVITSVRDEDVDNDEDRPSVVRSGSSKVTPSFSASNRAPPTLHQRTLNLTSLIDEASDSEDLDAIPRSRTLQNSHLTATPTPPTSSRAVKPSESTSNTERPSLTKPTVPSFPSSKLRTTTTNRQTPFDMLDEYTSTKPASSSLPPPRPPPSTKHSTTLPSSSKTILPSKREAPPSHNASTSTSKPTHSSRAKTPARSMDLFDELYSLTPSTTSMQKPAPSTESTDRFSKRKADREKEKEKEDKAKKKMISLDDIPTFLF